MNDYMNFFLKKSDINKNEFYNYNPKRISKKNKIEYKKITEPVLDRYVIFDFETTGLSPYDDSIIEIGAIKVLNKEIIGEFNELVDPQRPIPPFISNKVHITDEMVRGKRIISEVLKDFAEFIEDYTLIAHNADFDMRFLIKGLKNMGLNCKNPAVDTLYLSRKYLNLEKNNLRFIARYYGIELKNAHRAFADVSALYEIYKIIIKKINEK